MEKHRIDNLLIKVSSGDNDAFAELYKASARGVFAFLYSYLHDYHETEDATQTVFLKLKRAIHSYKKGTNGSAWMLQIAKNHAIDIIRSRRYYEDIDGHGDQGYSFDDGSVTDLIDRTLAEDEAKIVTLHVLWQFKHREIAELLDMPIGTVTSKYKRSLEKLKKEIRR